MIPLMQNFSCILIQSIVNLYLALVMGFKVIFFFLSLEVSSVLTCALFMYYFRTHAPRAEQNIRV